MLIYKTLAMKKICLLYMVLLTTQVFAQDYVLDGVKQRLVYSMDALSDSKLSVLYCLDGQMRVVTLDPQLKETEKVSMDFTLQGSDDIRAAWYNGKTVLLKEGDLQNDEAGKALTYSFASTTNADIYKEHYVCIGTGNTKLGEISNKETAKYYQQTLIPDPSGGGYYFFGNLGVTKLDNSLKVQWTYKLPKSFGLVSNVTAAMSGCTQLYYVDNKGLTFIVSKGPWLVKPADKNVEIRLISLSAGTGAQLFNTEVPYDVPKVLYRLTKVGGNFCVNGLLGYALGSKEQGLTGTYQLVIDTAGNKVTQRQHASQLLSSLTFSNQVHQAYLRDFLVGESNSLLVFEKAFDDKFIVFEIDSSFNIIGTQTIDREHSDLKTLLTAYVSMFLGKGYNAAKLLDNDYVATAPIGPHKYLLMYKKIVDADAGRPHEYLSASVSFAGLEGDKKSIDVNNHYSSFASQKVFTRFWNGANSFIVGYTDASDRNFTVKKMITY